MDITSFILGISSVIVAALVAGVVIGLVKIKGLIRYQRELFSIIDNNAQNVYNELTAMKDNGDRRWRDHHRTLDSRLDKLIARIDVLEEKIDESEKFEALTQIKALDSRLYTVLSRIERLEKQSVSVNKNKQLLND